MTETVKACPECDTTQKYRTSPRGHLRNFCCYNCGAEFDKPNERPPKHDGGGISAKKLLKRIRDD